MNLSDERLKCCIAVTINNKVYMYRNVASITLTEGARNNNMEWDGWSEFCDAVSAKDMVALAKDVGIKLDFKKGDKIELSLEVWEKMCKIADDRRQAPTQITKRNPVTGDTVKQRGRKPQNLGARHYSVLTKFASKKEYMDDCPCTTRQARKVYEFFVDEVISTGGSEITEARMMDIVNDRQSELNTKQDPWRIFQYYRPELIQCKLVKLQD